MPLCAVPPPSPSLAHLSLRIISLCVHVPLLLSCTCAPSSLSVCLTCASYLLCFVSLNCLSIVWLSVRLCVCACVRATVNYWKRQAQRGSETHQGIWSQGGCPLCMHGPWNDLPCSALRRPWLDCGTSPCLSWGENFPKNDFCTAPFVLSVIFAHVPLVLFNSSSSNAKIVSVAE